MSHELRTPLNGIIGLSNILLSEQYLPSQQQFLETLYSSADHMKHIVDDILDYNKIDAGKLTLEHSPFNLYHLLEKLKFVFAPQAEDKGLKFHFDAPQELRRNILGDVTRLQQVLNNLLSNAIKFTDKGSITLSVKLVERLSAYECLLEYSVTDTGIGIPAHKRQTIFESFTQADVTTNRKYGGTGLGLTISKKLVSLMGGDLILYTEVGAGSKFSFRLHTTCHHVEVRSGGHKTIQSFAPFNNLQILLAEDNPVNMVVARNMLVKWNIQVTAVENGQEAVTAARNKRFDLILMDLEMPVMDGWQAVQEIRKFSPYVPILAFTAASYDGLDQELAAKGINGFVHKPFRIPELHSKITAYTQGEDFKKITA